MPRKPDRQRNRIDRIKERAALALAKAALSLAKAAKRRWLVYLLLTVAAIAAVVWFAFK